MTNDKPKKHPLAGLAATALAGAAGYAALRKFRPSAVKGLRELQEAGKSKKGFGVVMEGNQGKAVEGLLGSKVYTPENAPHDRTLLHHGVDDLKRKATKTDINAGDVPYELGDKKTFPKMLERAGAGDTTPKTRSVGELKDKSHEGIQRELGKDYVVKDRMGSMTKSDDLITEKTPIDDPKRREYEKNPDNFIAQSRVPIHREYRVHTLNNVPFSITHRRLPHEGARRVWNKLVEKVQGEPGGGGSFLPVMGKKRKELHQFVQESTKHLPTGVHQAFDVAELPDGKFKFIESNPFPGSLGNPVIARRLQRQAMGRWGHDVAGAGGLAAATAAGTAIHEVNKHRGQEKRSAAVSVSPTALLGGFADELFKVADASLATPVMGEPMKYYQQRVVNRIQQPDQPGLVVAHGLGTGKTRTAIESSKALGMDAAVVVPASLKGNYEKEVARWNPNSKNKTEIGSLQGAASSGTMPKEPLLIVDEAHRMRDPGSKTYQAIRTSPAQKRILLTASPFYNHPNDIAPLIDAAAGHDVLPKSKEEFEKRYVSTEQIKPGFFDRLRGIHPGERQVVNPKAKPELTKVFKKWVDYHQGTQEDFPTVARQDIKVPMSKEQLHMYDTMLGRAPAWVSRKIKAGLPPDKQEAKQLNAFLGAVRQVSNTTRPFQTHGPVSEPKIDAAFGEAKKTLDANPRAKVVVYSNYIGAGINPYKERLEHAGIPYGEFVGGMKKTDRDELVRKYNSGEIKVLLLSSAGGEGLDLKGTRTMQILDPHWNWEKIKQVEGRGIRYKSHAGLPPEEQNVTVQRFVSTRPRSGILEDLHLRKPGHAVDEYLQHMSYDKERLIDQFKALLPKEEDAPKTASARARGPVSPRMMLGFAVEVLEKKAVSDEWIRGKVQGSGANGSRLQSFSKRMKINAKKNYLMREPGEGLNSVTKRLAAAGEADNMLDRLPAEVEALAPGFGGKFKEEARAVAGKVEAAGEVGRRMKRIAMGSMGLVAATALPVLYLNHLKNKAKQQHEKQAGPKMRALARMVDESPMLNRLDEVLKHPIKGPLMVYGPLALGGSFALGRHVRNKIQKQHEKQAVSDDWIKSKARAGAEKAKMPRLAAFNSKMQDAGKRNQVVSDVAEDVAHQLGDDPAKLEKMHELLDTAEHTQGMANKYRHAASSSAEVGLERLEKVRRLARKAGALGGLGLLGITGAAIARHHGQAKEQPKKWTVKHAAPASGKLVSEIEEFGNVLKKPKVPRGTPPHGVPHKPVAYDASGRTYRDTVGARMRHETESALAEGLKEAAAKMFRSFQARAAASR